MLRASMVPSFGMVSGVRVTHLLGCECWIRIGQLQPHVTEGAWQNAGLNRHKKSPSFLLLCSSVQAVTCSAVFESAGAPIGSGGSSNRLTTGEGIFDSVAFLVSSFPSAFSSGFATGLE